MRGLGKNRFGNKCRCIYGGHFYYEEFLAFFFYMIFTITVAFLILFSDSGMCLAIIRWGK